MTATTATTTVTMVATPYIALFVLRVISPALVFFSALSLLFARPPAPSESPIVSVVVAVRTPRRALILSLLTLISLTYLLDGLTFVVYAVVYKHWPQRTGIEVNAVVGLVAFSGLAALGTWKDVKGVDVWSLKRVNVAVFLSTVLDIAQAVLYGVSIPKDFALSRLLHFVFPTFRVLLLVPLFIALITPRVTYTAIESADEYSSVPTSTSLLLPPEAGAVASAGLTTGIKYGTFRSAASAPTTASGPATRAHTPDPTRVAKSEAKEKEINLDPSWSEIYRRLRRISPYLWPSKSRALQFIAVSCILILVVGRVVNFAVPWVLSKLIAIFEQDSTTSPWPYLLSYVGLRFLQSSGGLPAVRDSLWAPVMQYSDRVPEMSQLSFDHLLNLSFAWHTRRKTGEVLRILDRGAAINHTLELLLFNVIPTFVDILVALVVFTYWLDWTLAVVIFFVMFAYVAASVVLTKWRTKLRRRMNDRDVITRGIHTDCLLNYETVKYFNGEDHEGARYAEAIRQYQSLEYRVIVSMNLLNLVQNFIITVGLLVGSLIVAQRVVRGQLYPSDFVFFITYLAQLYGPLNSLGYIYRSINQSLVDTERLLQLLHEPTDINDKPNAPDLIVTDGEIEFENVNFTYDGRQAALKGVSFKVPKGGSVALVGESGAGKSTILRLLYRFYDLKEGDGRILVDGQDIRDVKQASLRKAIGVVPQDSVLFNASVAYNIGYGKFGATQEELEEAAKAAQMHDRILTFPEGYETKVGERGIRLSGGEKQRVAIARTLLKNPPILLLDEATSALDTSTERDIQKALQNLVQGRSSLSIAHRLSTIASADLILVLKDGQIVEQGTHKQLLEQNGIFATMWADQITAAEEHIDVSNKEAVVGYDMQQDNSAVDDDGAVVVQAEAIEVPQEAVEAAVESPDVVPADAEHSEGTPVTEVKADIAPTLVEEPAPSASPEEPVAPVAFPSSDPEEHVSEPAAPAETSSAPIAFPSDDAASQQELPASPPLTQSPGITFAAGVDTPPRTGTPDPEAEPKRKRISSQNFQRLARRISVTTRRAGSVTSIPILGSLRRDSSSVGQSSTDDGASRDMGKTSSESPAPSIQSEETDKDKGKKKEKKEKKRRTFM
ncbi:hypothetical protein BV25DRAFT_1901938 [Artomyces pyxidatus]|uniref:Uncharacterized protein n=1 Tax=Artomyces pyxidatus TaxID=48021 RepID=A0ACB8SRW6_9AGAM|nr:hypothetical protein BV25DRAFT_1901938 [Artomyces pyxidatus]